MALFKARLKETAGAHQARKAWAVKVACEHTATYGILLFYSWRNALNRSITSSN